MSDGTEISNSRTGQAMRFLDGAGDSTAPVLRIETTNPATGIAEPTHVHPHQESRAQVTQGELCFEVDGAVSRLAPGDEIIIPAGTPHRFWNQGSEEAVAIQEFRPALEIEDFFRTYFDLANRGKLKPDGSPPLLLTAALGPRFADVIRVTSPPWWLQRAVFLLLGPLARQRGR